MECDSDGYVNVNSDYKTSMPHVYALGGVTGKTMAQEGMNYYTTVLHTDSREKRGLGTLALLDFDNTYVIVNHMCNILASRLFYIPIPICAVTTRTMARETVTYP